MLSSECGVFLVCQLSHTVRASTLISSVLGAKDCLFMCARMRRTAARWMAYKRQMLLAYCLTFTSVASCVRD